MLWPLRTRLCYRHNGFQRSNQKKMELPSSLGPVSGAFRSLPRPCELWMSVVPADCLRFLFRSFLAILLRATYRSATDFADQLERLSLPVLQVCKALGTACGSSKTARQIS